MWGLLYKGTNLIHEDSILMTLAPATSALYSPPWDFLQDLAKCLAHKSMLNKRVMNEWVNG